MLFQFEDAEVKFCECIYYLALTHDLNMSFHFFPREAVADALDEMT